MKEKLKKEKKDTIVIKKRSLKNFFFKIVPILLALIFTIMLINYFVKKSQEGKLYTVKSETHLKSLIDKEKSNNNALEIVAELFSASRIAYLLDDGGFYSAGRKYDYSLDQILPSEIPNISDKESSNSGIGVPDLIPNSSTNSDYSKTNVQIENIDEADVIKTDGGYVYSISNNQVLITEVIDNKEPKVLSRISTSAALHPTELLLNKDKLVVISLNASDTYFRNGSKPLSSFDIYDISNKSEPIKIKGVELNSQYNTSRMIDNKVYIFSSAKLKNNQNVNDFREYKEDYKEKEIPFSDIKYIKSSPTNEVTTFISIDLNLAVNDINISSYLVNLETAYISFENVYLLESYNSYWDNNEKSLYLKALFGFKGIFGPMYEDGIYEDRWRETTKIAKYTFSEDKKDIKFVENTKVKGKILNQYSCDEKDGNLRIALNDNKGTRIKVLDPMLKEIGDTGAAAAGEDNKSVRFAGDRAYFVTYKQVDPLYAIDLSNPRNPKIMGELKIPGFSTYLHPYDDNHIIGIGMATNEEITRDVFGRPIRERITFNGMKMTLFDISDIRNPKEKDVMYFGDSRTDSPINQNAKALLFSKEKNLIAIPVSNMGRQFPIKFGDSEAEQEMYRLLKSQFVIHETISEGYIVFNITTEGFKYKGIISHEDYKYDETNKFMYYTVSRNPLRGLYIGDNLLTVSNHLLKINNLETLEFLSNIDLINGQIKEEVGNTFLPMESKEVEEE